MELLPVSVVESWHTALNTYDDDLLSAITADDFEVMTATGCHRRHTALREWRGFTAEPFRWFCGPPGLVVVEQVGSWHFPPSAMERVIASAFRVFNGRIVRYRRFDDLRSALAATSLTEDDEVLTSGVAQVFGAPRPRPPSPPMRQSAARTKSAPPSSTLPVFSSG